MRTGTGLTEKNLRQLLNEWDPIGVADEVPDEYDCMLAPLLGMLRRGADQAEIAAFLRTELVEHFGLTPSASEPEAVATRLMALKAEDA
ncbi:MULTISPECIES: hypothetical protein [unclassified Streptomyces]|uniref:hypothetical protein n=1 Tax=Streptomyces TaxID=1883 RepID=UPI00081DAA45|nr:MULTISPECIES: hypothetical protein [unclassified Streptomyces]PVC84057.1 hypothetical protein DBP20_16725 [Streptomyces sp. CS131]SCF79764.1 hypothetical protein GA0115280_112818 [Streptomyces sp. Cmuel-A718b]